MMYLNQTFTVGPPAKSSACEKCVYARGEHAAWCPKAVRFVRGGGNWADFFDPEKWNTEVLGPMPGDDRG
jgi:hypothetical protein